MSQIATSKSKSGMAKGKRGETRKLARVFKERGMPALMEGLILWLNDRRRPGEKEK